MIGKILIDRSVVEQALRALEKADRISGYRNNWAEVNSLIAALEQPQDHHEQHLDMVPAGWKLVPVEPADSQIRAAQDTWWHACNCETYWDQIYAAMIAAAPQPSVVEQPQVEKKAVAWLREDGKLALNDGGMFSGNWKPLYTHSQNLNCKSTQARLATLWGYEKPQPKRGPLTDEEITALADAHMEAFAQFVGAGEVWFEGEKEFARAIESAHGIGGEA